MWDVSRFQRGSIHVLQKDLNLRVVVVEIEAPHDVGVIHVPQDLYLTAHLSPHGVLVVAVDDFERVDFSGGAVDDLVHGATGSAPDAAEALELAVADGVGGRRW